MMSAVIQFLVGLVLIVVGAGMISLPLGVISLGLVTSLLGVIRLYGDGVTRKQAEKDSD